MHPNPNPSSSPSPQPNPSPNHELQERGGLALLTDGGGAAAGWYSRCMIDHPLKTNSLTTGVLCALGDLLAQTFQALPRPSQTWLATGALLPGSGRPLAHGAPQQQGASPPASLLPPQGPPPPSPPPPSQPQLSQPLAATLAPLVEATGPGGGGGDGGGGGSDDDGGGGGGGGGVGGGGGAGGGGAGGSARVPSIVGTGGDGGSGGGGGSGGDGGEGGSSYTGLFRGGGGAGEGGEGGEAATGATVSEGGGGTVITATAADASAYAADAAPGGFSIARTGRNAVFGMFVGGPLLSLWFRTLHIVARSSRVTYEPLLPALAWFGARFPAAAASLDRVPLLGG